MRLPVLRILVVGIAVLAVAAGAASARLSESRYDKIDAVVKATTVINESDAPATAAQLRAVSAACAKLDDIRDTLLESQAKVCAAGVAFLRSSQAVTCESDDACVDELDRVIRDLSRLRSSSIDDNKVINSSVEGKDCRKALRTPSKDLVGYKDALRGFRSMRDGIEEGSSTRFNSGKAIVDEVDVSSLADKRKAFAKACKP